MSNIIQDALARLILDSPLSPRKRWFRHMSTYYPILKDTFAKDPWAQLLTLRALDALYGRYPRVTLRRLEKLRPLCNEGSDAEKAMFLVLKGLHYHNAGLGHDMARCFRHAAKCGHNYHVPHILLADHYLFERAQYQRAWGEFDEAINCIYQYPPMNEQRLLIIARVQCDMACCLMMMHRTEEAEKLIGRSEMAKDTLEYRRASAFLAALRGEKERAEKILPQVEKEAPGRTFCIRRILEGTHSHFTAKTPDEDKVRAYWDWFLREERTLLSILDEQGKTACFNYHHTAFGSLVPEPMEEDAIQVGIKRVVGRPRLTLDANHSRTYTELVNMMLAACPEEIRQRWDIVREAEREGESSHV